MTLSTKSLAPITKKTTTMEVAIMDFQIDEVVWAKLRGFVHWPAKVKAFCKNMIIVVWFNDYRTTKLYKSQLSKFLPNFDEYSKKFDKTVGLKTAAQEALIFLSAPFPMSY